MDHLEETDLSSVCRSCLKAASGMKNMVDWGFADDFCNLTNIKINKSDHLPEMLCEECEDFIVKCRSFKAQCQESDLLLKNSVKKKQCTISSESATPVPTADNSVYCKMKGDTLVVKITAPNMESKILLPCPYPCGIKYLKRTDLLNHLIKRHKADKNLPIDIQFYCSFPDCSYFINSSNEKYFSGRKYLNQHIFKVHRDKIYCNVCNLGFSNDSEYNRHLKTCNCIYICQVCDIQFNTNEKLLIHLIRKHPDLHKQYKSDRRAEKRKLAASAERKKIKTENDKLSEYICDSPKRSFATQTLDVERHIKNDVTLTAWQADRSDYTYTKKDEISTQTVFEDLLSLKSQNSDDDSIFFSETVSLSDIQTQTVPLEFGLSRSNKETITSETQSPDLSIKETQTCFCLYDSPKGKLRCAASASQGAALAARTSTETQTLGADDDALSSVTSAETQTCFDDHPNKHS